MGRLAGRWAFAFAILVSVWGLNYVFVRWGLGFAGPLWLAGLRAGVGALGVGLYLVVQAPVSRLDLRARRDALLIGIPNTAAFFGLWFIAAGEVPPGETAVIIYTFPLWVALLSFLWLREPIRPPLAAAIVVGFVGVTLISEGWEGGGGALAPLPITELLAGSIAWAVGTIWFKLRFRGEQVLEANVLQLASGSAVLLVAALVLEPHGVRPSVGLFAAEAWLGLAGTALAYSIWFTLLARGPATELSGFVFLVPVVALGAASLLLRESTDLIQLAGTGLVLMSVYLASRSRLSQVGRDGAAPT